MKTPNAIWIDPLNRGVRWVEEKDAQPALGDIKYVRADLEAAVPNIADFLAEIDGDKYPSSHYNQRARIILRELGYV